MPVETKCSRTLIPFKHKEWWVIELILSELMVTEIGGIRRHGTRELTVTKTVAQARRTKLQWNCCVYAKIEVYRNIYGICMDTTCQIYMYIYIEKSSSCTTKWALSRSSNKHGTFLSLPSSDLPSLCPLHSSPPSTLPQMPASLPRIYSRPPQMWAIVFSGAVLKYLSQYIIRSMPTHPTPLKRRGERQ